MRLLAVLLAGLTLLSMTAAAAETVPVQTQPESSLAVYQEHIEGKEGEQTPDQDHKKDSFLSKWQTGIEKREETEETRETRDYDPMAPETAGKDAEIKEAMSKEVQPSEEIISEQEYPEDTEQLGTVSTESDQSIPAPEESADELENGSEADETDTGAISEPTETENDQEETGFVFPEVRDKSVLQGLDFSTARLLVGGDEDLIVDPEHLLYTYEGVSLLQYESPAQAKKAYAYYLDKAEFVDTDCTFTAASGQGEMSSPPGCMTREENPLAELDQASEEGSRTKGQNLIALIDTGAGKGQGVAGRISMLGDDPDDDNGHGNRMIREMRSVDPNVQILSVKALDADGRGTASSIYAAIEYAISQDVKIINLSVSAYVRADNACIREVIEKAADRGIIVVGAAGNAGKNVRYYIPGNIEAALIAGACDENGKRLSSSNYGETVDCLVAAPSTSEASAKLSAWISGRPDEVSWKEALEQEAGRNGLIFPADQAVSGSASEQETQEDSALDEGQTMQDEEESETEKEEDDGFLTQASVKVTSSEYLRQIYYKHIGAGFKVSYGGKSYHGTCAHDLIPAIPSKNSNLTIDYHKTITVKDKGSWYYTYAKIIYNAYYNSTQYNKLFDKYPRHTSLSKEDSRLYYTGLAMSYAQGNVYKDKSSIKHMIYNSKYGYDIGGTGAGLGKKVYKWVKNNGIDLPVNVSIDVIWAYPSSHSRQPVIAFRKTEYPVFQLQKKSVDENGRSMSLIPAGAVYTIYSDADCKNAVVSLVIQKDGYSQELTHAYFTANKEYYIRETALPTVDPPSDYEWVKDEQTHSFTWSKEKDEVLTMQNILHKELPPPPEHSRVRIRKTVKGGCEAAVEDNSLYSLAGAKYGIWGNASCTGDPLASVTTSDSGYGTFPGSYELGRTIYVREMASSRGYRKDPDIHSLTVTSDIAKNTLISEEVPVMDPFTLHKMSFLTQDPNTSFDGAVFKVSYYPTGNGSGDPARIWYFETKNGKIVYDKAYLASGYSSSALFYNERGSAQIPLGVVMLNEIKAPAGYVCYTGTLKYTISYDPSGEKAVGKWENSSYLKKISESEYGFLNKPLFGGVKVQKTDAETGLAKPQDGASLKGTEIGVYNDSGKPVLYYDGDTYRTAADQELVLKLVTDENGRAQSPAASLGAGKYYVKELTPPFGYLKNNEWKVPFTIEKNGKLVDLSANPLKDTCIRIRTNASVQELDESSLYETDENGQRKYKDISITDTITYENMPAGTYLICGTLMDKKTKKPLTGASGEALKAFSVEEIRKSSGTAAVSFLISGEDLKSMEKEDRSHYLEGASLVVYESFYSIPKGEEESARKEPEKYAVEGNKAAVHENLQDPEQDIRFPSLRTHAGDGVKSAGDDSENSAAGHSIDELGRHEVQASDQMVITDHVTYKNLHGHTTYTVNGTLHKKDGSMVLDDQGKPVTASAEFMTEGKYEDSVSGFVELIFGPFSGLNLAGETVVAFESGSRDGKEIMIHADLEDAPQMIYIPAVHTNASGKGIPASQHEAQAEGDGGIEDLVSYENLRPGGKYEIRGTLVYKMDDPSAGIKAGDPVMIGGKPLTANRIFTADGSIEVPAKEQEEPSQPADLQDTDHTDESMEESGSNQESESESDEAEDFSDHESDSETEESEEDTDQGDVDDPNTYDDLSDEDEPDESEETDETGDEQNGENTGTTPSPGDISVTPGIDLEQADKEISRAGKYQGVSGTLLLSFDFDTSQLVGKAVVVFEELIAYDKDGNEKTVGLHKDILDEGQTVNIVKIGTKAADDLTKTHVSQSAKEMKMTDTVRIDMLQTGKTYTVSGKLMDKQSGKAILVNGSEVTASRRFSYEDIRSRKDTWLSEDGRFFGGSIDLEYKLDSTLLTGKCLVVFERLYREGYLIAQHEDIDDEEQTVDVVDLHTQAFSKESGTHEAKASGGTVVTDLVTVENLLTGQNYRLTGQLMDARTGKPLLSGGKEIKSEKTFSWKDIRSAKETKLSKDGKHYSGTVQMEFPFDASMLAGHRAVVFEKLWQGGTMIAHHEDLSDEDQSIDLIDFRTTAQDKESSTHESQARKKTVIEDTVLLKNLLIGKTYTVKGRLMEKSSQRPFMQNGKEITASRSFTFADLEKEGLAKAEADGRHFSGKVTLSFFFDSSQLAGTALVAFEKLYRDKEWIASHEDIDDEDQSIQIVQIRTSAEDEETGTHTVKAGQKARIIDTVSYKGLTAGKKYVLKGKLMDKTTGKAVKAKTKAVSFTAGKKSSKEGSLTDGTQEVSFRISAKKLAGKHLVVFEELLDSEGNRIAVHEDLSDQDQTVYVEKPEKKKQVIKPGKNKESRAAVKTGALMHPLLWTILFLLSAVVIILVIYKRNRL